MRHWRLITFFLIGVAVLTASASGAATTPSWLQIDDSPARSAWIKPEDLVLSQERRRELTQQGHILAYGLLRSHVHLRRDGTVSTRTVEVRHLLSEQGVQSAGDTSFPVATAFETASIDAAFSRTPEGRVIAVEPDTVRVVPDTEGRRVFSDRRRVVVPFAGLRVGSTTVLVAEDDFRAKEWPLPWSGIWMLQGFVPLEIYEITVEWDEGVPAPAWKSDSPTIDCDRSARRLTCRQAPVPALVHEPELMGVWDLIPQLVVGFPTTWADLAIGVGGLVEKQLTEDRVVRETARSLIGDADSTADRIAKLHRFVADDVRYVAIVDGEQGIVPHPPRMTLERRFGDCKDKVTLFLALARAAGISAHPVLVGDNRYDLNRLIFPTTSYFDHMIACVDEPGAEICLDPTELHAPTGDLPLELHGSVALDLQPGTTAPRTLPQPAHGTIIDIESATTLACDDSIEEDLIRRFSGGGAINFRRAFQGATPEMRVRSIEDNFRDVVSRTVTPQVELSGFDSAEPFLTLHTVASFAANRPLDAMSFYAEWDPWLYYYGVDAKGSNRNHPYRFLGVLIRSTHNYTVCPTVTPAFGGAELELESPFGRLVRTYEILDQTITVHTSLDLPAALYSVSEEEQLNEFLEKSLEQTRVLFGLHRSTRR